MKFIQIVATGTGAGGASYATYGPIHLYGLTADGDVYEWIEFRRESGTVRGWKKLEGFYDDTKA